MDRQKRQIEYWRASAERNWRTANFLFKGKRYDACLFFCHLTIEKMLKGLIVKNEKKAAPYTHDLAELANIAKVNFGDEQIKDLRIITNFNIAGRYDNEKFSFYKQCTKSYTEKYFLISKQFYLWLKKEYLKK